MHAGAKGPCARKSHPAGGRPPPVSCDLCVPVVLALAAPAVTGVIMAICVGIRPRPRLRPQRRLCRCQAAFDGAQEQETEPWSWAPREMRCLEARPDCNICKGGPWRLAVLGALEQGTGARHGKWVLAG